VQGESGWRVRHGQICGEGNLRQGNRLPQSVENDSFGISRTMTSYSENVNKPIFGLKKFSPCEAMRL
jgi:hypothetical protein